jgi:phosphoribosylformylglycinamidine synthase subunit PurQ / glutaminase
VSGQRKKFGILRFWGTNCDRDIWQAGEVSGWPKEKIEWLWQDDQFRPEDYECFVVPGGFSYGDYLRCGALAAKSPAMKSLREAADKGYPILGICNGFQILCEAKLLPGVLVRNESQRFIDRWIDMKLENQSSFPVAQKRIRLPIAHGEGRFFADELEVRRLEDNGQVWLRYVDNPNGAIADIAGVMNAKKNVAGLMPHPERALFDWMGGTDGRSFFDVKTVR